MNSRRRWGATLWAVFLAAGACHEVDLGGRGVRCNASAECAEGYWCRLGSCHADCEVDRDCPAGVCVGGACVDREPGGGAGAGNSTGGRTETAGRAGSQASGGANAGTAGNASGGASPGGDGGASPGGDGGDGEIPECILRPDPCPGLLGLPGPPVSRVANPLSVVPAQLNGDDIVDLAVVGSNEPVLNLFIGLGGGTFTLQTPLVEVREGSDEVVAGDFDGDGWSDLAIAHPWVFELTVVLNRHDGEFSAQTLPLPIQPVAVAVGDLNRDGHADLALAGNTGDGADFVLVLFNRGDGTFDPGPSIPQTGIVRAIAVGDLNEDGWLDLVVTNSGDRTAAILINQGEGAAFAPTTYPASRSPHSVAVADFDDDGHLDVAIGNFAANSISLLLGHGDGTFEATPDYPVFSDVVSIAAADIDGDGTLDLLGAGAASSPYASGIRLLLNQGDGTFADAVSYPVGEEGNPDWVVAADLNQDGSMDAAVTDISGELRLLLNDGRGGFVGPAPYVAGPGANSIAAADLDRDGVQDLALTLEYDYTHAVSVLPNRGDGSFGEPVTWAAIGAPLSIAAANLDADAAPDLAFTDENIGVSVRLNDGTGRPRSNALTYMTDAFPFRVGIGDLNADGAPDLAVVNRSSVTVLVNDGQGLFEPAGTHEVGDNASSVAIADFDQDGLGDLAVTNSGSGNVSVLFSRAMPDHIEYELVNYTVGATPWSIVAGDWNCDGKIDLAVANMGGNSVSVLENRGRDASDAVAFETIDYPMAPTRGILDQVVAADLNLDGLRDLAVHSRKGYVSVLFNLGGGFGDPVDYPVDRGAVAMVAADLNHDRRPDLALANFERGTADVLLNRCIGSTR